VLGDDLVGSWSAETHEAALELTTGPHATVGEAIAGLDRRSALDPRLSVLVAGHLRGGRRDRVRLTVYGGQDRTA
jgi:hypothetical protein